MKILIMGGGTGGHIFPGIAVAHYLKKQGCQVHWLGTNNHMEAQLVPKNGIDIEFIKINGLRNKSLKKKFIELNDLWRSVKQVKNFLKRWNPDVVLGMGGYVSGPGGLAAWNVRIPIVLHEQNSIAGFTNYWLSKIACKVLQAFPSAFSYAEVVGNPIRSEILRLPDPFERMRDRHGPLRILVIGGSQGSKILNQIIPIVADQLSGKLIIWHQVGKGALEEVIHLYKTKIKHSMTRTIYRIVEFIDNIAEAYAWADIVISRSGALTVSEISTIGIPALFIPFIHKDRQQYWNAIPLQKAGAAKIIEQKYLTPTSISKVLVNWNNRLVLLKMAQKSRKLAIHNSTEKVAREVIISAKSSF